MITAFTSVLKLVLCIKSKMQYFYFQNSTAGNATEAVTRTSN